MRRSTNPCCAAQYSSNLKPYKGCFFLADPPSHSFHFIHPSWAKNTMTTATRSAELNNGVWTSWLPLTTAWPSQAACNSEVWARNAINVTASYWPYEYDAAYGQSVANTLTCLPPQVTKWWNGATEVSNTITSWSIGPIVCPAAFTTVSTTVISGSSTSVICCPTYVHQISHLRN